MSLPKGIAWTFWITHALCDCTAGFEDCLATGQDAAASWVQVKTGKVHVSKAKGIDSNGYYFSKRAGDAKGSNTVSWPIPQDLTRPAWVWRNEMDEKICHSPLIDDKKNIYVAGTTRLRKFSPDGDMLWLFNQDEITWTSPTMGNGLIYFRVGHREGHNRVYALSMETGDVVFNTTIKGFDFGPDAMSLLLADGRLFLPALARSLEGGSDSLIAINASTGVELWTFTTDHILWNFSPTTPDDGKSITFSSTCGLFFRLSADDGQLMVKSGDDGGVRDHATCLTGGGSVGPNGIYYAAHGSPTGGKWEGKTRDDFWRRGGRETAYPGLGGQFWQINADHFITAFNISTGEKIWSLKLDHPYEAGQSPAVGYLYEGGPLAVVAAIGQNGGMPQIMTDEEWARYSTDADYRRKLNVPNWKSSVIALDARTGSKIWRWDEKDWDHFGAAGDEEGFTRRINLDSIEGPVCNPDVQGIPIINTHDGVVVASSSHNGNMTLIRDANRDGVIQEDETIVFPTGQGFLNSPATAPDMIVAAPCWGPMYVFRQ